MPTYWWTALQRPSRTSWPDSKSGLEVFSIYTERLKKAEASELHISTTEHVVDTSGEYKDEEGNPYMYAGHWSWIYFDNNECACNDDDLKAFDFVANCLK